MTSSAGSGGSAGRVVVTGAAGFLGAHLVRRLLAARVEVVAIARPGGSAVPAAPGLVVVHVDLDSGAVHADGIEACAGVSTVYHLAGAGLHEAQPSPDRAVARTNVSGTLAVVDLFAAVGASRLVHCGSGLEYGPGRILSESSKLCPAGPYAATKAAATLVAQAAVSPDQLTIVRPFTVYGEGDSPYSLISQTIADALRAGEIRTTFGEQTRDFVHVDDVVDALVLAGAPQAPTGVFNVATEQETSVRQVVEMIVDLCGSGVPRYGAIPYRPGEPSHYSGSAARARAELGWEPRVPLRKGLSRAIAWQAAAMGGVQPAAKATAT